MTLPEPDARSAGALCHGVEARRGNEIAFISESMMIVSEAMMFA